MRFSSDVLPRQPLTCAQPVMPAFTLWRSMYCGIRCLNCSTKNGRSGRGPTIDMSPLEHVPELRQLVDVVPAQPSADPRRARVVVARPDRARHVFGVDRHRSELVDGERFAVESHALLRVEHRPRRAALDEPR